MQRQRLKFREERLQSHSEKMVTHLRLNFGNVFMQNEYDEKVHPTWCCTLALPNIQNYQENVTLFTMDSVFF